MNNGTLAEREAKERKAIDQFAEEPNEASFGEICRILEREYGR